MRCVAPQQRDGAAVGDELSVLEVAGVGGGARRVVEVDGHVDPGEATPAPLSKPPLPPCRRRRCRRRRCRRRRCRRRCCGAQLTGGADLDAPRVEPRVVAQLQVPSTRREQTTSPPPTPPRPPPRQGRRGGAPRRAAAQQAARAAATAAASATRRPRPSGRWCSGASSRTQVQRARRRRDRLVDVGEGAVARRRRARRFSLRPHKVQPPRGARREEPDVVARRVLERSLKCTLIHTPTGSTVWQTRRRSARRR